jgi:hypothetical protein
VIVELRPFNGAVPLCGLTHRGSVATLVGVLRCIARAVTILALCCAIGLQWLALQSIAWTAMIVDYSKNASLCHAIAQTFDGTHPCSLCQIVRKAKAVEKQTDLQPLMPKVDMICPACGTTRVQPFADFDYATFSFSVSEIRHSPAVPPPRFTVS